MIAFMIYTVILIGNRFSLFNKPIFLLLYTYCNIHVGNCQDKSHLKAHCATETTFLTCEKNHPTNQRSQTIFLTCEEKVSNFPASLLICSFASKWLPVLQTLTFLSTNLSNNKKMKTQRKTEQNLSLLNQFLSSKNEKRSIEDIPSAELNLYLSEFIIKVRTK